MKKILTEKTFCYIFNFICILLFFVLFQRCLSMTGENIGPPWDEHIFFRSDSILCNSVLIFLALISLSFVGKILEKLMRKNRNILLCAACVVSAVLGVYWVWAGKIQPDWDQLAICHYADAFNRGDFEGLMKGNYLARYPQQIGMVTLLRGIFKIFGETEYQAFQYLSALLVPLLVLSGCNILRILSDNNIKAEIYYLFFAVVCFPMYAYTTFVYGDLISSIVGMFSVWMYLSSLKRFTWWKGVAFGLSIGVAVCLRKNLLILAIALIIVMVIKLIFQYNRKNLVLLAALILGWGGIQMAVWGIYANVKDADARAIPGLLFIVMGLNDDYEFAGWNNDYEYAVFSELNDDVELAKERAYENLHMYLEIYKKAPGYMVDFFVRKMNAQWNAPMYQSLAMNGRVRDQQLPVVREIFAGGRLTNCIEMGMKIFQLLMYGGILYLVVCQRKRFVHIETYVLLIAVFGGFLFSLMWEAKTRYVLPYLFMQIPYMAMGVGEIIGFMEKRIWKTKDKTLNCAEL